MIRPAGAGRCTARRRGRATAAALGFACATAITLTGCAASPPADDSTYGGLPSFLPAASVRPDLELTGTVLRPALTSEGDSVEVVLGQGISVHAVVSGPVVPGEGLPDRQPATTCTWTVTLTGATGDVPISVADFSTIDHFGTNYHPDLVPGAAAPPATIGRGQTVTFQLRSVMMTGEGLLRWAPHHSPILASWDFEVEND